MHSNDTTKRELTAGIAAHKAGDLAKAKAHYFEALKLNPSSSDAYHNLGILFLNLGKNKTAEYHLKNATTLQPQNSRFWQSYLELLLMTNNWLKAREAIELIPKNILELHGLEPYLKKIATNTENGRVILDLEHELGEIVSLHKQGNSEEVENRITKLKLKNIKSKNFLRSSGLIFAEQNKQDLAIQYLNEAQELDPKCPITLHSLATTYQKFKQAELAKQFFLKTIKVSPKYSEAHYNFGNLLMEQHDFEGAIKHFKLVLTSDPLNTDALINLGACYRKNGELQNAKAKFQEAAKLLPENSDILCNIGIVYLELNSFDKAEHYFRSALGIDPDNVNAMFNLGKLSHTLREYSEAIQYFHETLRLRPNFPPALEHLGFTLHSSGLPKDAVRYYERALDILPNTATLHNNIANSFLAFHKRKRAQYHYQKAIDLEPKLSKAYWNLLGASKSIPEAMKWNENFLRLEPNSLKGIVADQFIRHSLNQHTDLHDHIIHEHANNSYVRSLNWFKALTHKPKLFFDRWSLFDFVVQNSPADRPFYEFGVWTGLAFEYLAKFKPKGYGFDTWEGLPEDWHHERKGSYSAQGNIPKIKNGEFITGRFEDSLPKFFDLDRPKASIINFDADLYSSTKTALNFCQQIIDEQTILVFDEFIINPDWEQDEYKALEEFCEETHQSYEVLAVSFFTKQVAVRLV